MSLLVYEWRHCRYYATFTIRRVWSMSFTTGLKHNSCKQHTGFKSNNGPSSNRWWSWSLFQETSDKQAKVRSITQSGHVSRKLMKYIITFSSGTLAYITVLLVDCWVKTRTTKKPTLLVLAKGRNTRSVRGISVKEFFSDSWLSFCKWSGNYLLVSTSNISLSMFIINSLESYTLPTETPSPAASLHLLVQ